MIDVNFHGDSFDAESVIFSENYDPFVTFEIQSDEGNITVYIRNTEDAERIAQAALELLKNVQSLVKAQNLLDPTND